MAISVSVDSRTIGLSLFAYLSACYLVVETNDIVLQDDFTWRALASAFVAAVLAPLTYLIAGRSAQGIREGLMRFPHVWFIEIGALIAATIQIGLIVVGWGAAQYPYLVRPDLMVPASSAPPPNVLVDIEIACAAGGTVLIPSLFLFFLVFKAHRKSVITKKILG
jgi:cytochrome d ubiquinol oxidase subunit II